jgi:hypothetical protein
MKKKSLHIILLLLFISVISDAQTSLSGFNFQALVFNQAGNAFANRNVDVKFNIYFDSLKTSLAYGEDHSVMTNKYGLFTLTAGHGSYSGGANSSFSAINWSTGTYFFNVLIDTSGLANYIDIGFTRLVSVPYAFYSQSVSAQEKLSLDDLSDADTSGLQPGYLLKWNGGMWVPSADHFNDTVAYASQLGASQNTDTASYALNTSANSSSDTSYFALNSDSSYYSHYSSSTDATIHSLYSDTTGYAYSGTPGWSITGNFLAGANSFLGTRDNKSLSLATNNISRLLVSASGFIGINTTLPQSKLHILSNENLVHSGTFGASAAALLAGAGTRMLWSPSKGAFRVGGVSSNYWNNDSIGNYSFTAGYNNKASGTNIEGGNYSMALGSENTVAPGGSIALGYNNAITKYTTSYYGSCLAMGRNNILTYLREVVIGSNNLVTSGSSVTIGTGNTNAGNINSVVGYQCKAAGNACIALGYYANTNTRNGSFVFSDASSTAYTNSLTNNDFIVRASGGTVFFTDADTTMGVYLAPGSGSWSSISDRTKKENFTLVNDEEIIAKVYSLPVKKWKYKTQKGAYHIGVIAQEFYETFHFGESPEAITMSDMDGVLLSCIKAVNKKTVLITKSYNGLELIDTELESVSSEFMELEKRLNMLEKALKK